MTMAGFAICRVAKLKSFAALRGSGEHTDRKQETPNADAAIENLELILSTDGKSLEALVKDKIGDLKYRQDAVLCAEYFLGASPEYFRPDALLQHGAYQPDKLSPWVDRTMNFLQTKHGDNLIKATLHLDEKTPHIAAYVVPIHDHPSKPNTKILSYKRDFGGSKYTLSNLQTEYHQAVEDLGLARGAKGSKAAHREVDEYYQAVHTWREFDPESLSADDIKALAAKAQERDEAVKQLEGIRRSLTKRHYDQLQESIRRLTSDVRRLNDEKAAVEAEKLRLEADKATLEAEKLNLEAAAAALTAEKLRLEGEHTTLKQVVTAEQQLRLQSEQALRSHIATDQAKRFIAVAERWLSANKKDHIIIGHYAFSKQAGYVQVIDVRDGRGLANDQNGHATLCAATTPQDFERFQQSIEHLMEQQQARSPAAKPQVNEPSR